MTSVLGPGELQQVLTIQGMGVDNGLPFSYGEGPVSYAVVWRSTVASPCGGAVVVDTAEQYVPFCYN